MKPSDYYNKNIFSSCEECVIELPAGSESEGDLWSGRGAGYNRRCDR